jgi:alpha-galactosidase
MSLESGRADVTFLRLRWRWRIAPYVRVLADTWERAYGELGWRDLAPERALPWYFVLQQGEDAAAFGVETQPNAFCFWQCDPDGLSLWIDLRNGGEPANLAGRQLALCRVLSSRWSDRTDTYDRLRAFCARMCQKPLLPAGPIVGSNDWNNAYGRNTAAGILRDARLMVELSPPGHRPFVVIDDGWQDKARFPDLGELAAQMSQSGARPGIWIRPLRAEKKVRATRLSPQRFGDAAAAEIAAYDPSVSDGMDAILRSVRDALRVHQTRLHHLRDLRAVGPRHGRATRAARLALRRPDAHDGGDRARPVPIDPLGGRAELHHPGLQHLRSPRRGHLRDAAYFG